MVTIDPNSVMRLDEATPILDMTIESLRKLVRKKELPASLSGNKYLLTGQDILDYLSAKKGMLSKAGRPCLG